VSHTEGGSWPVPYKNVLSVRFGSNDSGTPSRLAIGFAVPVLAQQKDGSVDDLTTVTGRCGSHLRVDPESIGSERNDA
jgi:hypothetical protein